MTLKIIKHYLILLVIFFSWVSFANAGLEITEINNPEVKANNCWIKIYNNDSNEVTLTDWFVMDDYEIIPPQAWHYHKINATDPSELTLAPNSYAIIADSSASTISAFKSKNLDISGPLFYGSLTFKDEGTMGLSKDKKTIIGQMSYGITNESSSNDSLDFSDNANTTTSSLSSYKLEVPAIPKITTKIISPKTVTSGIPFSLSSLTTTNTGETYAVGKFVWNFGDGMVKEVSKAEPYNYNYDYPGEYVVTLSYFDSLLNKVSDATDRITIKVVPSEIYISSVGDNADPFIEIENKSNYEIVLSNWMVTAGVHYFIIPNGTSILPGKKIKLSPKITGFVGEDIKSVNINDPSNNVVATYPAQQIKTISKSVTVTKPVSNNAVSPIVSLPEESQVINLNDLSAEAENSGANIPKSFYPFLGLIVVIGLGISSFLIIRTRNKGNNLSDGRIRAEDIAIIE